MNLVSSIIQSLTPDMISRISSMLGLDRTSTQKAVQAGVPSILAGLANLASSPNGARQLSNALTQQQSGIVDQLRNIGDGNQQQAGTQLLSGLLGAGGMNALAGAIGHYAGVGTNGGQSMLGVLSPIVTGALSRHQQQTGLDANGLASYLSSQKNEIARAMPAGVTGMLSNSGLLDAFEGTLHRGTEAASAASGRVADMAENTATGVSHAAAYAASRPASTPSWPYWLAGLAALAAVGGYLFTAYDSRQVAERPQAAATAASVTPDISALTNELNTSISTLKTTLTDMTNPSMVQTALPKLEQATAQLDKINALKDQLPVGAREQLANTLEPEMASLNELCSKILATPEIAATSKPAIDTLLTKLEALTKA